MLKDLFNKYDCDKSQKHQYHLIYQKEFDKIRNDKINFLEIGVFKGNSLEAWLEYFPNATLYGIDIFTRVDPFNIPVLKNNRVKYIKADSTSPNVHNLIKDAWPDIQFDVIIDDGLHTPLGNKSTLENLIPFLKDTGAFYIEDVWPLDIMTKSEMSHPWIKSYKNDYTKENMDLFLNLLKQYTVEKFDNRNVSKQPDSVIYKITK